MGYDPSSVLMTLTGIRKIVFTKEMVVLIQIITGEVKQMCEK